MGAFSKKSLAKIEKLCDNKIYIAPVPGPPIRGQYSKGRGYRVRGDLSFQLPQGPGDEDVQWYGVCNLWLYVTRSEVKQCDKLQSFLWRPSLWCPMPGSWIFFRDFIRRSRQMWTITQRHLNYFTKKFRIRICIRIYRKTFEGLSTYFSMLVCLNWFHIYYRENSIHLENEL